MERSVAARMAFKTVADTKVALAVSVARNSGYSGFMESLSVTSRGEDVPLTELSDHHGGRFHYMEFAEPSEVLVEYTATVTGFAVPEEPRLMELIRYVRPSRYAESDRLLPTAYAEFGGLQGAELVHAVRNWVFSECATSADPHAGPTAPSRRCCTAAGSAATSPTWRSRCCAPKTFRPGSPPCTPRA